MIQPRILHGIKAVHDYQISILEGLGTRSTLYAEEPAGNGLEIDCSYRRQMMYRGLLLSKVTCSSALFRGGSLFPGRVLLAILSVLSFGAFKLAILKALRLGPAPYSPSQYLPLCR